MNLKFWLLCLAGTAVLVVCGMIQTKAGIVIG